MFKGILFDLDGVITNTAQLHFAAWQKLILDEFKCGVPAELEPQIKGISRDDSLRVLLTNLDLKTSSQNFERLTQRKNDIYQHFLQKITKRDILPGISALITELQVHNIEIALASASQNGPYILKNLGLTSVFNAVVDPVKVDKGKPAPDIFIAAANEVQLNVGECIGIEDSVAGIQAINTAGAMSVGISQTSDLIAADVQVQTTAELNYTFLQQQWQVKANNA